MHEYFQGSLCSPATARAVEHAKSHNYAENANFKIKELGNFYITIILTMHLHLLTKNIKPIHGELTELWQFYCQHQINCIFLFGKLM